MSTLPMKTTFLGYATCKTSPVTDIELARIAGGTVALHDARRNVRWSV